VRGLALDVNFLFKSERVAPLLHLLPGRGGEEGEVESEDEGRQHAAAEGLT